MVNTGILLALISAGVYGVREIYQKETVVQTDEWVASWAKRFISAIFALPALYFFGIPDTNWWAITPYLIVGVVISFIATVLISKAYKHEEVSFLAPLGALSPVPVLLTEPLILGEYPSLLGIIGVLIIVAGVYLLKIDGATTLSEPVKRIATNRAAQLLMLVTLMYSITANFDSIGVEYSSAVMWVVLTSGFTGLLLTPVMMYKTENWKQEISDAGTPLVLFGGLSALGLILQMAALEYTLVVYVSAVKRLSIPVSVILAFVLYNETNIRGRTIGTILTVTGAIFIAMA
jgi:uncharacterized membrane protein